MRRLQIDDLHLQPRFAKAFGFSQRLLGQRQKRGIRHRVGFLISAQQRQMQPSRRHVIPTLLRLRNAIQGQLNRLRIIPHMGQRCGIMRHGDFDRTLIATGPQPWQKSAGHLNRAGKVALQSHGFQPDPDHSVQLGLVDQVRILV